MPATAATLDAHAIACLVGMDDITEKRATRKIENVIAHSATPHLHNWRAQYIQNDDCASHVVVELIDEELGRRKDDEVLGGHACDPYHGDPT